MEDQNNLAEQEEKVIYRFNTSNDCLFPVMKKCFGLSDMDIYYTIESEFDVFRRRLSYKKISYEKLKLALIPNQDKDRKEICFVFDSDKIESDGYARYIFDVLIPLLDKESTYSILYGDYIDILDNQSMLHKFLDETMVCYRHTEYRYSAQFFLVYFNRLTKNQYERIVEGLAQKPWFIGYVDITHGSSFKSYVSMILINLCVKCQNKIIASHPADYLDEDNINMKGYSFEKYGFEFVSINEESFNQFLNYKIETEIIDDNDISFSFNALFPKFDTTQKLKMSVNDSKWYKYLMDKENGKGVILEKLGYSDDDKEEFIKRIYKKICCNYLYNLRRNKQGVLLFNVCIELPTVSGNMRKTMVGLKYLPEIGEMQIITVT